MTAFSVARAHKLHDSELAFRVSSDIVGNRNFLVRYAIKGGFSHILFVDSDISFPDDALARLFEHDKDIVGAPYNKRSMPIETTVKFLDNEGYPTKDKMDMPDRLFRCAAMGLGMVLIKTSVFEKIPMPWFQFEYDEQGQQINGEDVWFFIRALNAGFDVWCDPLIEAAHHGEFAY